jgi:flavodoxin/ferredoxin
MHKCLIVYFSQSGSTAAVAERIAAGLRASEFEVDLCNIKDSKPPDVRSYDLFGLGMPVYFYNPPYNVMEYVQNLPVLNGIPAFVFLTYGTYRFDAGEHIRRALASKGARIIGYCHCRGADLFLGYLKKGYLFSPDNPRANELAQAEAFGRKVAARVGTAEHGELELERAPSLIYRIEKLLLGEWFTRKIYSRFFTVDKAKCNGCGICWNSCPTSNITKSESGYPVWGRNCLLCLTCEKDCPEDAITSPFDWPIIRPILSYNVRVASRDPQIEHVKVVHKRGSTTKLME